MPVGFFETLASAIKRDPATGDTFLNVICYELDCANMENPISCSEGVPDPEAFVVANAFGVDSCGNVALKLRICDSDNAEV